ncbi:hypothetical protein COCOBI_01-4800 [Coccomyxa sp. Obi]|nr:hypothetical protein COCOBI_01-4800 [Coccomyxa sp. Obi]
MEEALEAFREQAKIAQGETRATQEVIKRQDELSKSNSENAVMKLQLMRAKAMQLEGRFDMRGLLEISEEKYRSKYEADPNMQPMKGVSREGLWKLIYANEPKLAMCLKRYKGFSPAIGPASMAAIYARLSGVIHTGDDKYQSGGGHILGIFLDIVSKEEAKALQCLAVDLNMLSQIHVSPPASST